MFVGVSCGGEFWGLDVFRQVEELGYDGLFTGEHLLFHRPVWDAVSMCTAMACATERIAIGPAATIAPLRHPTLLAKEMNGVDLISGGRLVLTLGVGGDNPKEFAAAQVPLERLGRRTTEALEILRGYFSGERFSYSGEIYQVEDVWLDPPAGRPGGPPLWVAGRKAPTVRRAAVLADGFLPYMYTASRCARAYGEVRELAAGAGRELPADYAFGAYVYVALADDADEGRRRADDHMAWRYAEPRFRTELSGKYAVGGDADSVVAGLQAFADAGCTHLIVSLVREDDEPPLPFVEAFASEVLPRLRAPVRAR